MNNASQTLNLSGLSAGQTYTLSFDLYAIDSWEGNNGNPDQVNVVVDGTTLWSKTLSYVPTAVQTINASAGVRLQVVPVLTSLSSGRPGEDDVFTLNGSGFMEGASTITVGGVAMPDPDTFSYPFDVTGSSRNSAISVVAPRTLDGPIRISTEGGFAELPTADFGTQPLSQFSAISASAAGGVPTSAGQPSAVTGQAIVLSGQGFTSSTLVQFLGLDDTGQLGTLTRTGTVSNNGTTLTVVVPALARTGPVTVLGSNTSIELQVVPTLRSLGGAVTEGNTIVLEGTGLTSNDLVISIDGRTVGSFSVRTVNDGPGQGSSTSYPDQQLLTLVVPAGISSGLITVSTAGGAATLRSGAATVSALPALAPAAEVGNTLSSALDLALGANQSLQVNSSIGGALGTLDVDLYRLGLNAGDSLLLSSSGMSNRIRIFDASGTQLTAQTYNAGGTTAPLRWFAPATGTYYLGVSGSGNTGYDPKIEGSGSASSTGNYSLGIERFDAGSTHLFGHHGQRGQRHSRPGQRRLGQHRPDHHPHRLRPAGHRPRRLHHQRRLRPAAEHHHHPGQRRRRRPEPDRRRPHHRHHRRAAPGARAHRTAAADRANHQRCGGQQRQHLPWRQPHDIWQRFCRREQHRAVWRAACGRRGAVLRPGHGRWQHHHHGQRAPERAHRPDPGAHGRWYQRGIRPALDGHCRDGEQRHAGRHRRGLGRARPDHHAHGHAVRRQPGHRVPDHRQRGQPQ